MELCAKIVGSYCTGATPPLHLFPGDDWVAAADRPRGLPIGNLTSQLWGNFLLDGMDHRLAETEGCGDYLRYTDDFLLFANDKVRLWNLREVVVGELGTLRLRLAEPKSRLLATREGVPFCGFRFFPGHRPRILGATKRRFERRRDALARQGTPMQSRSEHVRSWYQFSLEANSEGLRRGYGRQRA